MKTVILAGGLGTRISEESHLKPKPMIEIGGRPILWHIMKLYSHYGFNEFIVCLGYKGYVVKEYFANYVLHNADLTVDLASGSLEYHATNHEPWRVTLVDTGEATMTGGRLKRVAPYLTPGEPFFLTYGDGVSDVDLRALADFHKAHGKDATITAVAPPGRYGALEINDGRVDRFIEKPPGDNGLINGGFFVLDPKVVERIGDDATVWEQQPLEGLAADGQLMAYRHDGFWAAMDTLRDKNQLEALWASGEAPWRR
ncbi:MAG: glucose-1-phosphate cytidylyltransferase [Alphaproteobacteria bacterium]|nr:glucose-1-phosphate cytidylyltransferase [Alphaproteobacteria bacterium]MBU1514474.1 glucose-1-phosphate cytidylyltransferase [Alphaproteobacteria bacterium]MBU2096894.1 glucose-1-phosphate cytidylyltransferase [Alphaproteobacteria bacterium]MBU2153521.1 glucose-1-phosphate cytidylyltransferase [Alphaproteobacteria bacterium]MBU2305974.1 glucose-1-phosphate cytidylyltransferase [Alphaproteobacteria bacterium]